MKISLLISPYVIPFIMTFFLSLWRGIYTWREKNVRGWEWITLLLGASAVWSLAQSLEYISTNLLSKIIWEKLQWFGIAIIPPAFLLLTLDFVGLRKRIEILSIVLLGLVPSLILILVYTNESHHLFIGEYTLVRHGDFIGMDKHYQIGFWLFMLYSYFLFGSGLFYLFWKNLRSPNYYTNQLRWIAVAASVTVVISALDTLDITPYPYFQPTVLAMSLFTIVVASNLGNLRTLDVKRVSRGRILETVSDPLFLFAENTVIIDLNVAAQNLINTTRTDAVGKPLERLSPVLFNQISHLFQNHYHEDSIAIELPGYSLPYYARLVSIQDDANQLHSRVLALSKVFDHNQIAAELQRSNSLIKALGQVAARAASASNPPEVMRTMGEELLKLQIQYAYVSIDQLEGNSTLEFISYKTNLIESLEKLIGEKLIGLKQHHSLWPLQSLYALENNYPVFVSEFSKGVTDIFSSLNQLIVKKALQIGGMDQQTRGIYVPLNYSDGTAGIITVWGKTLSEKDLPAFSVFGSQVGNAFEKARYLEIEKVQAQELEKSNALIQALSQVALRAASTFDPNEVLVTLGNELHKLGMHYSLFRVERDHTSVVVEYVSPDIKTIRQIEKLGDISVIGYRVKKSEWSPLSRLAVESRNPVFIPQFIQEISWPLNKFGKAVIERGIKLLGVSEQTTGYFIPLKFEDGEVRILSIWGDGLREKDLPAFSVFANQVSSAFESARLYSTERNQAKELVRSQDLINSLSDVAARISSSSEPDKVMDTLGAELKKFDMDCLIALVDRDTREAYIRFHSMEARTMQMAEKITRQVFTDQRIPLKKWPKTIALVFQNGQPVYLESFLESTMTFMPRIARPISRKALGYVGVDENTTGYFLPLEVKGQVFGCLSIWGPALRKDDLPAFSVFASQVSGAVESARLYAIEHEQALLLERSNDLLSALNRIAADLSSISTLEGILDAMRCELGNLGLEFTFTVLGSDLKQAIIEYVSLKPETEKQIEKISGISLTGKKLPKALWPKEGLDIYSGNQPQFHPSFSIAMWPLFRKIGKTLYKQAAKFGGILENTPGIILPMKLEAGKVGFLAVWGDSLQEKDVAAFSVFVRQVESTLDALRLFHQAQQEIDERRAAQSALLESREEYRGLFENAHDAIVIFDSITFQVLNVNERACEVYGYSRDEFIEKNFNAISQDIDLIARYIDKNIESSKHFNFETIQTQKDGTQIDLEINASVVNFQGKKAIQCINRDVTSRKRFEEKLSHDAFHDGLTDLPNRALFLDRLAHVIARSHRDKSLSFAVLFLDLDRFKDVNDSLGHLMGDQFLIEIAQRLKQCVRSVDTVARLGGDEFVILVEETRSIHDVTDLCARILNTIGQPIMMGDNEIVISGSVGIVVKNSEYSNPEEYLRNADIAMYRAKEMGRARYEIFNESMRTAVIERLQLEADLRRAIANQEFILYYQPILEIKTKQIAGFEALIRWQLPDSRIVSPAEFIPIAEETGLIHQIGYWVLLESCIQLNLWNRDKNINTPLTMSVNVSGVQLMMAEFPDNVKKIVQESGVVPSTLTFEITESSLIKDQLAAAEKLQALKALGINVHLDDFGTGYSSLSFLAQFPIDALKIDRQFVSNIDRENQVEMVDVITTLGKKLNLSVIAEGIETEEQLDYLKSSGCQYGQGYYYSKPVDARTMSKLLHEYRKSV